VKRTTVKATCKPKMTRSRSKLSKLMSSRISRGGSFHSLKALPPCFPNIQDMRNEGSRTLQGQRDRGSHSWFLLLFTERILPFRKRLLVSDANPLMGRD